MVRSVKIKTNFYFSLAANYKPPDKLFRNVTKSDLVTTLQLIKELSEQIEKETMVKLSITEKVWNKAQKNIFRLEAIPEYNVPEDLVLFNKWKQSKLESDKAFLKWLEGLNKTKERGVKMQRVRIVSLPFSDYIKYEIDFWKHSTKQGENILFLEAKRYEHIKQKFNFEPKDFWIFDDKILIIFHYDEKGDFVKEKLIPDKETIKKYVELKRELLDHAIPMDEFLKSKATTED